MTTINLPICPTCHQSSRKSKPNTLSTRQTKQCFQCYTERIGVDSVALPPSKCACGNVKSKKAKQCRECWVRRAPYEGENQQARGQPVPDRTIRQPLATFEEAWRVWDAEIGLMRNRFKKPPKQKGKKRRRVVVLPDLHVPYHEPSFLQYICLKEKDADIACLAGDLVDCSILVELKLSRVVCNPFLKLA